MVLEILAAVAVVSGPVALYFHNRSIKNAVDKAAADVRAHVSSEQKAFTQALYTKVKIDIEDVKKSHVVAVAEHVKAAAEMAIKDRLSVADVEVCDFCHNLVAKFEKLEDKIRCESCKAEDKK